MNCVAEEKNRHILVIDDNDEIHNDFRKILKARTDSSLQEAEAVLFGDEARSAYPKFNLEFAHQGEEGFHLVQQAAQAELPFALAFVDVRMPPGWDGIQTIERIWEHHPELQVVICTAYSDYSWDEIIEKLGGVDSLLILKKPFDHMEVRQLAYALTEKWDLNRLAGLKRKELEGEVERRTAELVREIGERKRVEEELRHQAFHDSLTGLGNRALFVERLSNTCTQSRSESDHRFAVLFLDMDRFKILNDSLGHAAGDQFLIQAAQRLQDGLRPDDTVARLGGDEFAVLLRSCTNRNEVESVAERIRKRISAPFYIQGHEIFVTVSIGIVFSHSSHYQKPEDLLQYADIAMYEAKALGKDRQEVFSGQLLTRASRELGLATELRHALESRQLHIDYQPIVSLTTGLITGAEALLRWKHPKWGVIPAADFIRIAEDTGQIASLGEWVLHNACTQTRAWDLAGLPRIDIAVNISAGQIRQGFVSLVYGTLQATELEPHRLRLELTESTLTRIFNLMFDIPTFQRPSASLFIGARAR